MPKKAKSQVETPASLEDVSQETNNAIADLINEEEDGTSFEARARKIQVEARKHATRLVAQGERGTASYFQALDGAIENVCKRVKHAKADYPTA